MTALAIYSALKFWLPMVTVFGFVVRAYNKATTGVTAWADKLLNNHLNHIQVATEETALLTRQATENSAKLLQEIRDDGRTAAFAVRQVQVDLKEYQNKDTEIQGKLVADLAVLLDRKP